MKKFTLKKNTRPEAKLSEEVEAMLRRRDWFVQRLHGNRNQKGFPDLYASHHIHGTRWIELKHHTKSLRFTDAQKWYFPRLIDNGTRIWLLNFADMKPLMKPPTMEVLIRGSIGREIIKEPPPRQERWGPEEVIQQTIIKALTEAGWFVMETHGTQYQQGLPDLYATHKLYGSRWIEVKNTRGWSFTPAQRQTFPKMFGAGTGIWILQGPDLDLLHKGCNLWQFLS